MNHSPEIALPPLSLYIHIPWCIQKCPYCDFNSHAIKAETPETAYISALLSDLSIDLQRFAITRPIHSIFIGGGTPSLFSPESFARLLQGIQQLIPLKADAEITLEANPGTFERHKFAEFRALGINRLSIGIQSFNDQQLRRLGRVHNAAEAIAAAETAKQVGFDNLNLDLMFGLPEADDTLSQQDVQTALSLAPSHISLYQLTLEPNTFFHKYPPILPNDDSIFHTQQACQALLAEQGFVQYEVSAYSQADRQCQHNLNYWQFGDYLGIGAGAHGKISLALPCNTVRSSKPKQPEQYLREVAQPPAAPAIATQELPLEYVMNQLRLKQGFTTAQFTLRTGLDPNTLEPALSHCVTTQLLEYVDNHYRCTEKGWNFLDSILETFISTS